MDDKNYISVNKPKNTEQYEKLYGLTTDDIPIDFSVNHHDTIADSLFDMHYELEVGVVLEGEINRIYDDYRTVVKKGEIWLNSIWEPHGFTLDKAPCTVATFLFKPELLSEISLGAGNIQNWIIPFLCPPKDRPQLSEPDRTVLVKRICAIEHLSDKHGIDAFFYQKLELLHILHLLIHKSNAEQQHKGEFSKKLIDIQPAINAVLETQEFIPEEDVAALCGMSLKSFNMKFAETMQISFAKFAQRYRIKNAAQEVILSHKPIKQIAHSWGFADVSHFYKTFKQYYAVTPIQYRKKQQQ